MYAVVLSCDAYRSLAEHMICRYRTLWPDHPFCFRLPYQQLNGTDTAQVNYIRTPAGIKDTVLTLLDDLGDNEWIYWCIDDKYPVFLDTKVKKIAQWVREITEITVSGILFSRPEKLYQKGTLNKDSITSHGGIKLRGRTGYDAIWNHQFLRVKVIRHLFNNFPSPIHCAKNMDPLKRSVTLPPTHRLFVTKKSYAVFGESTSRGLLTKNCYDSIMKNNLPLPPWFSQTNGEIKILGKTGFLTSMRIFFDKVRSAKL